MAEQAIRDRIRASSSWRVSKQLGRGQYGTAYLVDWAGDPAQAAKVSDQAVAKVVGLEFLPEKEHSLAFQEVELLRELNHPGIVGLRDHFMTEANLELVIVMEFCDGGDLRGEVKRRTQTRPLDHIPEAQIMMWFVQLTLALNYMHHRHILHRDLKSSNIFLITNANEGHDVKIGDFGISRVLEGTVDVAATVVGTPYYMSPEVCKAEAYGYKSDVWALGCVLYEMCMLKHAFESQSLLGLVYKIVSETYDPIPQQYSSDLRTLIDRVLDKSHYTRPSGKELMSDPYVRRFVAAAKGSGTGLSSDALGSGPAKQPQPRVSLAASIKSSQLGKGAQAPAAAPPQEPMRACEPSPVPPITTPSAASPGPHERSNLQEEQPMRREWCAPPFGATTANARGKIDDGDFRAKVYISRIRRALAVRRQNWLQIFASFDHLGNGQLQESEFDRAVTSMALGLSDAEIREVRAQLQGSGACVPVYEFGKALHGTHPQVSQLEEWGRSLLSDLTREAARAEGGSNSVAVGAMVRVAGLQSAAGMKLNGSEGVIESWDAAACRWVVRLTEGTLKSIRDENLEVLRPAATAPPSAGGILVTTALYRMLCEGGETAVSEAKFRAVVERLMPTLEEADCQRLLLLLPKSPEGRVDVPEVLSQLVVGAGGAHQSRTGTPGMQPSPNKVPPAFDHGHTSGVGRGQSQSPFSSPAKVAQAQSTLLSPPRVPGTVPSPRSRNPVNGAGHLNMAGGGGSTSSTAQAGNTEGARPDVALLRLAQRLAGRGAMQGPGLDMLKLFASKSDELRPEELCHAVSVLPLGISRAEVDGVFEYVRASGGRPAGSGALPFTLLHGAVEAALGAGVPSEASTLEHLNEKRLSPALQRLASSGNIVGRASPQDFRVTLMQAEPYLTHSQLDWLMMLTDKDGEGRLLPASLLTRLGWSEHAVSPPRGARGQILVPPRPAISSRVPIAPHTPRSLVVATAFARVRDRLSQAGPQVRLERVLGLLFDVASVGAPAPSMGREVLATLLGHLRLGISATEADELVTSLATSRMGDDTTIPLASLYERLQRAGEPEMEEPVEELKEAAKNRLLEKGTAIAAAANALEAGDWLPEAEFRNCLSAAFTSDPIPLAEEEEERLLLLAEKTASGEAHWRPFVVAYAGWKDSDTHSNTGDMAGWQWRQPQPPPPSSPKRTHIQQQRFDRTDPACSAQSWRSAKQGTRTAVTATSTSLHEKSYESSAKGGFCPCRRRCGK